MDDRAELLLQRPSLQMLNVTCTDLTRTLGHLLRAADNLGGEVRAVSTVQAKDRQAIRMQIGGLDMRGGERLCNYARTLEKVTHSSLEHVFTRRG